MPKVAFHTLGCKVNQYDTEGVAEIFKQRGYEIVDFEDIADVYVINTCTVTNLGDRKSRQMIRKAKSINDESVVVVMGCYAQTAADEVSKIPGVNLIIGTRDRNKIVELIDQYEQSREQINAVDDIMKSREFEEIPISAYENRTRAFLKIQEGCSQYCSYCIIPYARGPIRSRKIEDIISEVGKLASHGFKEVVLTGIHLASYGKDMGRDIRLIDVVEAIEKIEGIERVRLGSLEPTLITEEFTHRLVKCQKLCPQFHLSLQSGSDETLKRMNRKYTTERYFESVALLRKQFTDPAITTDVMVGFPGETDEEFEESYNFAKKANFSKIHVFKYSPRKGTPAAGYQNQVDPKIKEERSKRLIDLSNTCEHDYSKKFINTKQYVLFEQKNGEYIEGLTKNYIKVLCKTDEKVLGNIMNVMLKEIKDDYVIGEVEI